MSTIIKSAPAKLYGTIELVELDDSWSPWKFQINGLDEGKRVSMSNFEYQEDAERAFSDWMKIV